MPTVPFVRRFLVLAPAAPALPLRSRVHRTRCRVHRSILPGHHAGLGRAVHAAAPAEDPQPAHGPIRVRGRILEHVLRLARMQKPRQLHLSTKRWRRCARSPRARASEPGLRLTRGKTGSGLPRGVTADRLKCTPRCGGCRTTAARKAKVAPQSRSAGSGRRHSEPAPLLRSERDRFATPRARRTRTWRSIGTGSLTFYVQSDCHRMRSARTGCRRRKEETRRRSCARRPRP